MFFQIRDFLAENYDLKKSEIRPESELGNELGLTSFQLVEMCAQLEEDFDIEISEDELTHIICVQDMVKLIEKEVNRISA